MLHSRIIVTGASGLVGSAMAGRLGVGEAISPAAQAGLSAPQRIFPLSHADLDITDAAAVQKTIADLKPDLVINCAVAGVDECERDPALARAVNVDGPANLARFAPSIVHFSSNYVFDGRGERFYGVDDEPQPINEYGRTKLEGEREVARLNRRPFVIRSSWIFGPGKKSFISTVHQRLRAGERVRAVSDVWASTTYVRDLVDRVAEIIERRAYGLHHVVNAGVCSNESFAREAARLVGADETLIESASTLDVHEAPRPRYTPLLASPPLRHWRAALAAYIDSDR